MDLPLISVVIPTTDRIEGLERCIRSVLEQNYPNVEIVVVGNNYKNHSLVPDVLSSYESQNLKYFYVEDCKNANVARNFGAVKSNGTFVAFLDSDDFYLPRHLEICYSVWNSGADDTSCVFTNFFINESVAGSKCLEGKYEKNLMQSVFENKDIDFRSSTIFVKKEFFLQVKFDEFQFKHQDWAFGLSYERKFQLLYSNVPSIVIVESDGNRMSSRTRPEASIRFSKNYLEEPYIQYFIISRLADEVRLGSYAGLLEYKIHLNAELTNALRSVSLFKSLFLRIAFSSEIAFSLFKFLFRVKGIVK